MQIPKSESKKFSSLCTFKTIPSKVKKVHFVASLNCFKETIYLIWRQISKVYFALHVQLPPPPPLHHIWTSITRPLLVSKDRRHLFVTHGSCSFKQQYKVVKTVHFVQLFKLLRYCIIPNRSIQDAAFLGKGGEVGGLIGGRVERGVGVGLPVGSVAEP